MHPDHSQPLSNLPPGRLLMVRPVGFGFNPETAATNIFATQPDATPEQTPAAIQARALFEFDGVVSGLRKRGIRVLELEPGHTPTTPDAVFPNNWFSTHAPTVSSPNGCVVLYPMQSPSRRTERRALFIEAILQSQAKAHSCALPSLIDLTALEAQGDSLEGTGSLILDHTRFVAYAGLSSRTSLGALHAWTSAMQAHGPWRVVSFQMATESGGAAREIYHTNLVLSLGARTALWVEDALPDLAERAHVRRELESSGRTIIPLSLAQMRASCANALWISSGAQAYWALSQGAWIALKSDQREALARDGELAWFSIPTLEAIGGGSVRCMLGELL